METYHYYEHFTDGRDTHFLFFCNNVLLFNLINIIIDRGGENDPTFRS